MKTENNMKPQTVHIISEARWLLSFGTNPLDVAKALGRKPSSLYKMSERHHLADIKAAYQPYQKGI